MSLKAICKGFRHGPIEGPPDRSKIAIDHPNEVKYWSKHLGVTPDELGRLVDKVGNSAAAVSKELRLRDHR
jgi:hypothetical protein